LHLALIKSVVENDLDMEKVWQRKLRRIWQMKNKMIPASSTSSIECANWILDLFGNLGADLKTIKQPNN